MSLDSLLHSAIGAKDDDDDLKFVFVGGKGGVGKTTSSSAIATLLAERCNKRVLLISTDPAHSLSDAFLRDFTSVPTPISCGNDGGTGNLHVMEVDPSETMRAELGKWAELAGEISAGSTNAADGGIDGDDGGENNDMVQKITQFQEWLSGIPGIDEATALASAIEHIESDRYDLIVFDTAPTGHTLKLLGMPDILQAGIEKLHGWQNTIWGYWDVLKGMGSSASLRRMQAKEEVANMLENYKRGIQKVALMLQDQRRTRFVVVCIAEYLSISESRRLLRELKRNRVRASHVIVNQLVIDNALSNDELTELEGLAEVGSLMLDQELLSKTVHACRLTTARKGIQEKYLGQLKTFPETKEILDGICEVPLLAMEVTGIDALRRFATYMVRDPPSFADVAMSGSSLATASGPRRLYDEHFSAKGDAAHPSGDDAKASIDVASWTPTKGDTVKVTGLEKAGQYNGLEGVVVTALDAVTQRCGVRIEHDGRAKTIALLRQNVILLHRAKKAKSDSSDSDASSASPVEQPMSKAMALLDDPEIKALVASNPKFKDAVEDCISNPMNFIKYISDPEMSPLISKAMAKLKF
jgi:arsenite-transporting ATPase